MNQPNKPFFLQKVIDPADFDRCLPTIPRPLVFTNGCFDILHRGHVVYLEQARQLGASLLVALNTDESVRGLNKDLVHRPIQVLEERLAVIAALASVDYVTWFADSTPLALIAQIRPNVLVKAQDWAVEHIVGRDAVHQWGGTVVSLPFQCFSSTSQIIARILANEKSTHQQS